MKAPPTLTAPRSNGKPRTLASGQTSIAPSANKGAGTRRGVQNAPTRQTTRPETTSSLYGKCFINRITGRLVEVVSHTDRNTTSLLLRHAASAQITSITTRYFRETYRP